MNYIIFIICKPTSTYNLYWAFTATIFYIRIILQSHYVLNIGDEDQVYEYLKTMAKFGHIAEYCQQEDWSIYADRLSNFFIANDITSTVKRRALLLTVIGQDTYSLLRDLVFPKKPEECEYDDIIKTLHDHFQPKRSVIMERFKFNTRVRQENESIATYIAELKQLAVFCEFGNTLEDMLRDRLVCGVNDPRIQRSLLEETNLTFSKAKDIAQAMDLAESNNWKSISVVQYLSCNLDISLVKIILLIDMWSAPAVVDDMRHPDVHILTVSALTVTSVKNISKNMK